jgi:hypothetical protein
VAPEYEYLDEIVERMRRQSTTARPSIDEIRDGLIENKEELVMRKEFNATAYKKLAGRKKTSVMQQKSDVARRNAIRTSTPQGGIPIQVTTAEWRGRDLVLILDRVPDQKWLQEFQRQRNGHRFLSHVVEPRLFQFSGNKAILNNANKEMAQQIVDYFKSYLESATKAYSDDLRAEAVQREREEQRRLEQKVAEEEAMKRTPANVTI